MNIFKNTLSSINNFQAIGLSIAAHLVFLNFLPSVSLALPDELESKTNEIRLEIIEKQKNFIKNSSPKKNIKTSLLNKPVKKKIEKKQMQASNPVGIKISKRKLISPTFAQPVGTPLTPSNSMMPARKFKVSTESNFALNRSNVTPRKIRSPLNNRAVRTSYAKRVIAVSASTNRSLQSLRPIKQATKSLYKNSNSGKALLIRTQTLHAAPFLPTVREVKNQDIPSAEESGPEGDEFQEIWGQYTHSIQLKIANAKNYPALARERKQQGKAFLSFKLDREGKIKELFIEISSGHEILDKAAIKAIEEAAPFPNIPKSLNKNYAFLKIPISFILR